MVLPSVLPLVGSHEVRNYQCHFAMLGTISSADATGNSIGVWPRRLAGISCRKKNDGYRNRFITSFSRLINNNLQVFNKLIKVKVSFRKQTMHTPGPLRLAADVFGGACDAGRSNHPSLSLRRLHFHLFASWPPVGRAVLRTTQSRWARSTAAAASQGRLGTASSPGPEPRAVPSPLRSEPHATCDATNRHCRAD